MIAFLPIVYQTIIDITQLQPLKEISTNLLYLIVVPIASFIFFMLYRIYKNNSEYVSGSGRRLGKYVVYWMGNYRFKGNISERRDLFEPEVIDELRKIKPLEKWVDSINDLIQKRQIFAYDIKVTESEEHSALSLRRNTDDGIIISPIALDDRRYSWEDKRGEFSPASPSFKEKPKVMFAHISSEYHEIPTLDEGTKPTWIVAPIPMVDIGQFTEFGFTPDDIFKTGQKLLVQVIPMMKDTGEAVLTMKTLAQVYKVVRLQKLQIEKLIDMLQQKDVELVKKMLKEDGYRNLMNQQELVGEPSRPLVEPEGFPWAWCMAFAMASVTGWVLPTYISQLAFLPPFFSAVIAVAILGLVKKYTERNKEIEQTPTEREMTRR